MKALNLSDKPKEPNHQVYNSNQQQQEYRETDTAENSQYRKSENKKELTSQQLESAQQSAQKIPECSTGNAGSKHARQAEERKTADQSTSETQL